MRNRVILVGLLFLAACGGSEATQPPVDTAKAKVDPYATFMFDNERTVAGSGKLASPYDIFLVIMPDTVVRDGQLDLLHRTGCTAMGGFAGQRFVSLVALADTLSTLTVNDGTGFALAALQLVPVLRPGVVAFKTAAFDPLVSADTSRGHTRTRPVMWRWTLTDSGTSIREDSTTGCTFQN